MNPATEPKRRPWAAWLAAVIVVAGLTYWLVDWYSERQTHRFAQFAGEMAESLNALDLSVDSAVASGSQVLLAGSKVGTIESRAEARGSEGAARGLLLLARWQLLTPKGRGIDTSLIGELHLSSSSSGPITVELVPRSSANSEARKGYLMIGPPVRFIELY
jgi:autotransporter translocation and assembly factor TamB